MSTEEYAGSFREAEEAQETVAVENGTVRSPRQGLEMALAAAESWTPTAMEDAQPYPLPEVSLLQFKEMMFSSLKASVSLEPGIVKGAPPEEGEAQFEEALAAVPQGGYSYPPPYTRYEVPAVLYNVYPWITVGKVFFKQNGQSFVASASSIGNNAIWTAGHVVHTGNGKESGWSTDMIFVPAYRKGNAPFGKWNVSYMRTSYLWYTTGQPGGFSEDMAGAILYPIDDKKISQKVGSLGFAWNRGRVLHWHSLGYPAVYPFDGDTMHDCQASYAYDGTVAGVPPVAIGCDMTSGCSGGPWIWKLLSETALNGNNSYRMKNRPEEINSPYFDERAKTLWDMLTSDEP